MRAPREQTYTRTRPVSFTCRSRSRRSVNPICSAPSMKAAPTGSSGAARAMSSKPSRCSRRAARFVKNKLTTMSDSAPMPAQLSASRMSSNRSLLITSAMRVGWAASAIAAPPTAKPSRPLVQVARQHLADRPRHEPAVGHRRGVDARLERVDAGVHRAETRLFLAQQLQHLDLVLVHPLHELGL